MSGFLYMICPFSTFKPHGAPKIQKTAPMLMLTNQTLMIGDF